MKTIRFSVDVTFNEAVTDEDGVGNALDTLMETATSTPGILDEYGNPEVGAFYVSGTIAPPVNDPDTNWLNNDIQFPRLLAELMATVEFTPAQRNAVAESMDLTWDEIFEVMERADTVWQKIKEKTGK